MNQLNQAEATLIPIFKDQLVVYERALELIATIEAAFENRTDAQGELRLLNDIMVRLAQEDAVTHHLKQQIHAASSQHSAEFNHVTAQLRGVIEIMLQRVQIVENLAKTSRDRLLPQMSQQVTAKRMVNAYQSTG